ncbi:MAG: FHA domain-containing protein [Chloroflexota bacterium]
MRLQRYLFVTFIVLLSQTYSISAQETSPIASDSIALVAIGLVIGVLASGAILFWRQLVQRQRALLDDSNITTQMDETEIIDAPQGQLRIPRGDVAERLPIIRDEGDYRPYLVLELRQASNSFLKVGERFIVKPDDTPYIIGSQSSAGLRIIDPHVSSAHIRVDYDPQTKQYTVMDENSSNGSRWDGDTMVKKRIYRLNHGRDVTLELASSYGFVMYVDAIKADETQVMISPFLQTPEPETDIPSQEPLEAGVIASLTWASIKKKTKRTFNIQHNVTIIGRSADADVQIKHELISKTHVYLIWKDEQFHLLDKSSNGTWVTTGLQGRIRIPQGELVPLDVDTSLIIEVAKETALLDFHYTRDAKQDDRTRAITDKLPELPANVRPFLHVVKEGKDDKRRDVRINTSVVTIGRDDSNIIPLKSDRVAEHHAKILWQDGQFWLHDLAGMGTTINRTPLVNSKMPLPTRQVHTIRINEGRAKEETLIEFYYEIQGTGLEQVASPTQPIVDLDNNAQT